MPKTTKHQVIVATWEALDRPAVGARELRLAEKALQDRFGPSNTMSPAAIARLLADEGAELKHPEVIESDVEWRQAQVATQIEQLGALARLSFDEPVTLERAAHVLADLEHLRSQFEQSRDEPALAQLRTYAGDLRRRAQSLSRDRVAGPRSRSTHAEIAEWLKVWIQTPALFEDWLELRRRSVEFHERFN